MDSDYSTWQVLPTTNELLVVLYKLGENAGFSDYYNIIL